LRIIQHKTSNHESDIDNEQQHDGHIIRKQTHIKGVDIGRQPAVNIIFEKKKKKKISTMILPAP
jgi:hypothetical protein